MNERPSLLVTKWKDESRRRTVTLDEIIADATRAALERARDATCGECAAGRTAGTHVFHGVTLCPATPIRALLAELETTP